MGSRGVGFLLGAFSCASAFVTGVVVLSYAILLASGALGSYWGRELAWGMGGRALLLLLSFVYSLFASEFKSCSSEEEADSFVKAFVCGCRERFIAENGIGARKGFGEGVLAPGHDQGLQVVSIFYEVGYRLSGVWRGVVSIGCVLSGYAIYVVPKAIHEVL